MRSSLSAFSRLHGGYCAVVIAPFVAQALADDGWSEADVRARLWELSRADPDDYRRSWIVDDLKPRTGLADWASGSWDLGEGPPAVETPEADVGDPAMNLGEVPAAPARGSRAP